jgi:hypothetical protein
MNSRLVRVSFAGLVLLRRLGLLGVLTTVVFSGCHPLFAQNKALKAQLDEALVGKTVVSNIVIGGKAVPRGVQTDYPVNTVVSPEGQVSYRVEWGIIRTDVGLREMNKRFAGGTSFRVADVDLKDDRLELKLESATYDSAKLKFILGTGWQSRLDVASVRAQLSRVLVFNEPAQPTTSTEAIGNSKTLPSSGTSAVGATSTSEYRRASNAPTIPGRISIEQVQATLAAADEEDHQAFADLLQQAAALSNALLAMKHGADQYPNFARHPLIQEISAAQKRYGKNLQPTKIEDIEELKQLFQNVSRIFGKFAPPSSYGLPESVDQAIAAEQQRQQQIAGAKSSIVQIENALDTAQLVRANEIYQHLANAAAVPHFAQLYLQQTQGLGLDLASYVQAGQFDHRRNVSLLQQVLTLGREVNMLSTFESGRPLTKKYLEDAITNDTAAVRTELASLPTFQFNESSYRIPSVLSDNDKLAFVLSHLKDIDNSLAPVSETRAIVAQPDAMKTVEEVVGSNEAATLKATAAQIAAAEQVRASLADAQNSIQAKITAEKEARERRIAEAEARKAAENEAREQRIAEAKEAEAKAARAAKAEADRAANEKDAEACNLFGTNKMGVSAQARKEYADKATQNAQEKIGPDVLYDSAAGDNNRYLLIAAPPEHEYELNGFAAAMANSKSIRADLCLKGFSEVQFIVRYGDGYNQNLVKRIRLSFKETARYAMQVGGARPE